MLKVFRNYWDTHEFRMFLFLTYLNIEMTVSHELQQVLIVRPLRVCCAQLQFCTDLFIFQLLLFAKLSCVWFHIFGVRITSIVSGVLYISFCSHVLLHILCNQFIFLIIILQCRYSYILMHYISKTITVSIG